MGIGHLGSRVESTTLGNLAEKLSFSSAVSTRRAPNNSTHFTSGTHTGMPLPTLPSINLKPQSGRVLHVTLVCLKLIIIPTPQFSHSGTVVWLQLAIMSIISTVLHPLGKVRINQKTIFVYSAGRVNKSNKYTVSHKKEPTYFCL